MYKKIGTRSKVSDGSTKIDNKKMKMPIPEPDHMTMEFAQCNSKFIRRLCENESIPLSEVTKNKIYPIIGGQSGNTIAHKFLCGIQNLGFGYISPKRKSFKRAKPEEAEDEERKEILKSHIENILKTKIHNYNLIKQKYNSNAKIVKSKMLQFASY